MKWLTKIAGVSALLMSLVTIAAAPANAQEDRKVTIVNSSSVQLDRFYASRVSVDDWEEDILGDDVLRPGQRVNINIDDGSDSCLFDFKAVFKNGKDVISNRINVCQVSTFTYTGSGTQLAGSAGSGGSSSNSASRGSNDGKDRHVKIINETRKVMREFYASNVATDDWEEDILGQDTLRVGASVNINIDDGTGACLFDFKAVFADGSNLVRNRINVCEIENYRYTEN